MATTLLSSLNVILSTLVLCYVYSKTFSAVPGVQEKLACVPKRVQKQLFKMSKNPSIRFHFDVLGVPQPKNTFGELREL